VQAAHDAGLGVILDWVPGHFPADAHALARFDGTCLFEYADPREGRHPDWGTLIYNFGRREVFNYLVGNALFWIEHYGVDGLRVDALLHESLVTLLYRVTRVDDGAALVLKTLRPEAGDAEALAALVREEWLARRVPGQGFPRIVDHPPRAHLYYLMSWHPGETLRAALARGHRYATHELVGIGRELLRHVGALHRLGIVHRDLKPDNIHVDRDGQLRLLDLGVAASDGDDLREINNPGTPSYMAPELFGDAAQADAGTDLYACGVTLYELLTRKYPYGEIEAFQRPRFGAPVAPTRYRPDTPAWLEAVLLKACARDAKDRFETAEEFRLELERGAERPLASPRRLPLLSRNPALSLKIVAGLSLLLNVVQAYLASRT
jgi:protein phosphatase